MTQSEIIALGDYCEQLLANESFLVLVDQFEQQLVRHMLVTKPHEVKTREGIYASFLGLQEFIGNMKAIIDEKTTLTAPAAPSETDAQPEDID